MERIDGYRSDSHLFVLDGYLYSVNRRMNDMMYLRCRFRDACPGRVVMRHGVPEVTQNHTHEADVAEVQLLRLKTALRTRAQQENTALDTIFREEERRYPDAARLLQGLSSVRSTMVRSRREGTPRIPATLVEYSELIRQRQWHRRYGTDLTPEENEFFRGHVESTDGSVSAIFASNTIIEYVRNTGNVSIHMDATFKVVPRAGRALQLFTVHLLHDDMTFPMLYALMERKTRHAYNAVLGHLRHMLPNVQIISVMADYESAMRSAVVQTFPGTRLKGCWFHFARAVFKKSQELGLQRRAVQPASRQIIRAAMALPLLPIGLLENGVEELQALGVERNIDVGAFVNYLRRQWIPLQISVNAEYHRTNNSVESFHRQLYRFMERPHPNIWSFTERLKAMEHAKTNMFIRLRDGVLLPAQRRRHYVILDQRIRRAEEQLARDGNVRRFLLFMSHGVIRIERILNGMPANDQAPAVVAPQEVPAVAAPLIIPAIAAVAAGPVDVAVGPADIPANIDDIPAPPPASPSPPPPNFAVPDCIVCMSRPRQYLLIDCRHVCLCEVCMQQFRQRLYDGDDNPATRCPVCRTPIILQPIRVVI